MEGLKSCVDCPFCRPKKPVNDMVSLVCEYNGKVTGSVEKRGLKEGRGLITPPYWCHYRNDN